MCCRAVELYSARGGMRLRCSVRYFPLHRNFSTASSTPLQHTTSVHSAPTAAHPLPPSTIDGHNHGHHPTFVAAATTTTIAFVIASAIAVVSAYTDRADDINLSLHLLEVVGVTT